MLNMTEEKISVIPSVAEESRENEFFLIPRDGDFFYLSFTPRGLGSAVLQQRFREMFRRASLAQHDRKQREWGKKTTGSLFSVGATSGRPRFV